MSMDPKGMVDGPNMYNYAGGDPVNRWDPMGTETRALIKDGEDGQPVIVIQYRPDYQWSDLIKGYATLAKPFRRGWTDIGTMDAESGTVTLTNGRLTSMGNIKKFDNSAWTRLSTFMADPNSTWKEGDLNGIQAGKDRWNAKAGLVHWNNNLKAAGAENAPSNDDIFGALDKSTGLADQVVWFYATAGLEFASAVKGLKSLSKVDSINDARSINSASKRSGIFEALGSDPAEYWAKYYEIVGSQGDKLDDLLANAKRRGLSVKKGANASYSKNGLITYGPNTKRWELLEEILHHHVNTDGWKIDEIRSLKKVLQRRRIELARDVAEEIVIKQWLLQKGNLIGVGDATKQLLREQIQHLRSVGKTNGY